jgi:hypothetical protein
VLCDNRYDRVYCRDSLKGFDRSLEASEVGFLLKHVQKVSQNILTVDHPWSKFYKTDAHDLSGRLCQERHWLHHRNYLMLERDELLASCRIILQDILKFSNECLSQGWVQMDRDTRPELDQELADNLCTAIKRHQANIRRLATTYEHMYPVVPAETDSDAQCLEKLKLLEDELAPREPLQEMTLSGGGRYEIHGVTEASPICVLFI